MLRKPMAARLVLLTAALLAAPESFGAEPVDLLTNGGFEQGLAGWKPDPRHELVEEAASARAGGACLSGEVTEAQQALRLRRSVTVRAGNLYRFAIWARATKGTKLVLWATKPGERQRELIASWPGVPNRWRRYETPLSVTQSGPLELEIIAPSSHSAPAGRMWIDDITLEETAMPALTPVSAGEGFNDEPAMARAPDGSVYVAWISFRNGSDTLQAARLRREGDAMKRLGSWQVAGGARTYLTGLSVVPAESGVVIVYAAERLKNWDIFAAACGPDGPQAPRAITSHPDVDMKPAAVQLDETVWIVWESNRSGARRILAAPLKEGAAGRPLGVSRGPGSDYAPSIAVLRNGEIAVAWHSFRDNNYDIYLRRRSSAGEWGEETRLTRAASIDRHPILFSRDDELWLCYENAQTTQYRIGATNSRRLMVARITTSGLNVPRSYRTAAPLYERGEAPSPVFDDQGRLHIAYLRPRPPRAGWDAYLTTYTGSSWEKPRPLTPAKGMDRRPALVLDDNRAVAAVQVDDIPGSWSDVDRTSEASSDIVLASADLSAVPPAKAAELEPIAEPEEPFEAGAIRVQRGEDAPTASITYGGERLYLFYGDLHEHTDVSVCNRNGDQSIDESYQHMRDIAALDFACATDHGYNLNEYLWSYTAKLARANEDTGRFLTFLAEEWTSSFEKYDTDHPYGYYGHRNLIFSDPYFTRWWNARNGQTPAQVWEELRALNADFVHIPHQLADTGNVPTDWDFTDEEAQPVAEIFQVRGSYEYKGAPREAKRTTPTPGSFLQDAWARGIVIGVIASPDHGGGMGKACVYAPTLTRSAILDALRKRRCFGTTAARIFLDVRVNGHLMGEKVGGSPTGPVSVAITTRCPAPIERIDVCRNNVFIYTTEPEGTEANITFVDRVPLEGRSYYYVRVIQEDGEIAWASPVWFGTP